MPLITEFGTNRRSRQTSALSNNHGESGRHATDTHLPRNYPKTIPPTLPAIMPPNMGAPDPRGCRDTGAALRATQLCPLMHPASGGWLPWRRLLPCRAYSNSPGMQRTPASRSNARSKLSLSERAPGLVPPDGICVLSEDHPSVQVHHCHRCDEIDSTLTTSPFISPTTVTT